jgi:hypothetical protein
MEMTYGSVGVANSILKRFMKQDAAGKVSVVLFRFSEPKLNEWRDYFLTRPIHHEGRTTYKLDQPT